MKKIVILLTLTVLFTAFSIYCYFPRTYPCEVEISIKSYNAQQGFTCSSETIRGLLESFGVEKSIPEIQKVLPVEADGSVMPWNVAESLKIFGVDAFFSLISPNKILKIQRRNRLLSSLSKGKPVILLIEETYKTPDDGYLMFAMEEDTKYFHYILVLGYTIKDNLVYYYIYNPSIPTNDGMLTMDLNDKTGNVTLSEKELFVYWNNARIIFPLYFDIYIK